LLYKSFDCVVFDKNLEEHTGPCKQDAEADGAKLTERCWVGLKVKLKGHSGEDAELITVAVPRRPKDFLKQASQAGHPRELVNKYGILNEHPVAANLRASPQQVESERASKLEHWRDLKKRLEADNQRWFSGIPSHAARVLDGKDLALWDALLKNLRYPDQDLNWDMGMGFKMMGWLPASGIFQEADQTSRDDGVSHAATITTSDPLHFAVLETGPAG
jgi:hypothetical protein